MRSSNEIGRALAAIFGAACVTLFVVTPLDLRTQFALAGAVVVAAFFLARSEGRLATLALVLLSVATTARYLFWRLGTTLASDWSFDAVLSGILLAAELYACTMLLLAYGQSIAGLRRRPLPLPDALSKWPSVDVFIPTYNEPLDVVRATVHAAAAMDWPRDRLKVWILDDGRRPAFRDFAAEAGVGYLTREGNAHAKAGNLNHALSRTHGEFVAVFDCDHIPVRSFLQISMGWLVRDPGLAVVQTPHHFYSRDPFSRNLATAPRVPGESQLFYGVIQPGIDTWNASFFCGSCAVLRRTALEEVGGIAVETVTEDAHTALKMHRRGWRTAYLDVPQAAGLATETLAAHVGQRIRWARGMAQIFRLDNPMLGRGLSLTQRFSYFAAMLHFFSGVPRLVFLLAPIAYLGFGRHIFNALPLAAVAYGLPHLIHSTACNARLHGRFRHSFWSEVYETCLATYTALPTTLALIAPRKGRFNVTAKGGRVDAPYFDARIASPFLLLAVVNLAAIAAGAWKLRTGEGDLDSLIINVAWALHNLIILSAAIAAACERPQVRSAQRVPARLAAMLRFADGTTAAAETRDLGRDGASVTLRAPADVRPREPVWLSLFCFDAEQPLPAEVLENGGRSVRVRFTPLTLEQESHLVRAIFSRADAWLGWTDGHRRDRPLLTLASIAQRGFAGVGRALALSLRPPRRPALPERVPAPVRSEA
ncbi:MAG TPA: UDP-forming cellulose synthase catalytic subunit [Myxococcales bacterium]|nr:UDP-forming cellulose synthase catalytic subunit [Myxococcales bacterium]